MPNHITGVSIRTLNGYSVARGGWGVDEFHKIKTWLQQNISKKDYSFKDGYEYRHNIPAGTNFLDMIMFKNIEDLNLFRLTFKGVVSIQLLRRNEGYADK